MDKNYDISTWFDCRKILNNCTMEIMDAIKRGELPNQLTEVQADLIGHELAEQIKFMIVRHPVKDQQ